MHPPRALPIIDTARLSLDDLIEAKGATTVAVCLPARDEAATVGPIVAAIRAALVDAAHLVDELVVVDDHSTDGTARVAAEAGARVVSAEEVLAAHGEGHGKGEALWKSLHATCSDVVAWVDADITSFDTAFVTGLVAPLLTEPSIDFVKGFYERPEHGGVGGGRVTELAARPLLRLLFPDLAAVVQPLSGEYAGRRSVLEQLAFVEGYGVDVGLLIDVARMRGAVAIAQVDLGERRHRNRPLSQLGPQAEEVARVILHRAGVAVDAPDQRPALATLPEHRRSA